VQLRERESKVKVIVFSFFASGIMLCVFQIFFAAFDDFYPTKQFVFLENHAGGKCFFYKHTMLEKN